MNDRCLSFTRTAKGKASNVYIRIAEMERVHPKNPAFRVVMSMEECGK